MARLVSLIAGVLALAAISPAPLRAQRGAGAGRDITGTVSDTSSGLRSPITQAIVGLLGDPRGVRTDAEGRYRLHVPAGAATVVVRAIGFRRATATATAEQSTLNFVLGKDVLLLEGVTVTGEATTMSTVNATTAVTAVPTATINEVPATSLESNLTGKLTGVMINQNGGAPGGGAQIQIRGQSTILGQADPLYVVDGVIISNAAISDGGSSITHASGQLGSAQDATVNRIADINPDDIESIEILKSAAASAIYGSRATNGVVVITTKRGKSGETRYNVTQRVTSQNILKELSSRHFDTYADVHPFTANAHSDSIAQQVCNPNCPWYDYQSQLYGVHTPGFETVINATGGVGNTQYYGSLHTDQQHGIMMNTGTRKQDARLNLDQTIGTKLVLGGGVSVTHNFLQRGISNNDNAGVSPMWVLGTLPAIVPLGLADASGNYPLAPFYGFPNATSNPFENITHIQQTEDVWREVGNLRASYSLLSTSAHAVTLSYVGGADHFVQQGTLLSPGYLQFEPADGFLGTMDQINSNNSQVNQSLNGVWTFSPRRFQLNSATTSVGVVDETSKLNTYEINDNGLVPAVETVASGQSYHLANAYTLFHDQAYYVQEQMLLHDELLSLNFGVRGDRSSANGDPARFFPFPKFSAAYRFVNPLSRFTSIVDEVKLRAATGQSGNRPNFGNNQQLLASGPVVSGQTSIVQPSAVGNPSIQPETMHETEWGADATMFHNRVSLEFTNYARIITNLLLNSPLTPSSGLGTKLINGGQMSVRGNELAINLVPISRRNFEWTFRTSYTENVAMVDNIPVPAFNSGVGFGVAWGHSRIQAGQRSSLIWGDVPFSCVNSTVNGALVAKTGSDGLPCHALPIDQPLAGSVVRDTMIADANLRGSTQFTNTFRIGKLTALVMFDWRNGGYMSDMTNTAFDQGGNSRDYTNPSPVANVPLGQWRYAAWSAGDARPYIQDGTFVKLRELSFTYQAPESWANFARARELRLTASGRNLAMFSKYWGEDPEFNNGGSSAVGRFVDLAPYPPSRQFFFSFDLGY
ncbi:MAG TPA: SusC/RagA family TonB-linked outer membrane protein [Gemmatimonadaceae bacterium]|nr:SusC/RagA family TonB-linked outer membrane protein [Gemmatimonadaceae bacterium]